jgi:hypothetical protein
MGDTLAWIYHLLGRDPLAEPIIVIAARQRPDIAEIRLHAALILGATGKTTLAAQHLDAAIRLDPSFDARPDVKELRTRLKPSK